MDEIQQIWKRHQYVARASASFIYGILVSVAMNFFWVPGNIYSSGITGLAQLIATLVKRYMPFELSTAALLFILNVPCFSWHGNRLDIVLLFLLFYQLFFQVL
ncbi:integral membrane protein [Liquorilactobacillus sucicola DSM 21376 = JCM 15457]|nr:integral membrane protein [Liquorilactobacillus sucicola DSM 21376 = JCM 15457]